MTLTPAQVAYRKYLQSEHWRELRSEAFKVYGRKCAKCPATCRLDVHHLHYRHPWSSGVVADLQVLCWQCHGAEHGIVRVIPQLEKQKEQKVRVPFLDRLRSKVFSGHGLSSGERKNLTWKLMRGTAEERRVANEIFQRNSSLPKPKEKKKKFHPVNQFSKTPSARSARIKRKAKLARSLRESRRARYQWTC